LRVTAAAEGLVGQPLLRATAKTYQVEYFDLDAILRYFVSKDHPFCRRNRRTP
jgi:hypothetical protein